MVKNLRKNIINHFLISRLINFHILQKTAKNYWLTPSDLKIIGNFGTINVGL